MISNADAYLQIATAALTRSRDLAVAQTRPRPGGGEIKLYDPSRQSFKQSLIAIVFAGIYLDATLYIEGCRRFGSAGWRRREKKAGTYEEKLAVLGITDHKILSACTSFRQSRNDVVHERAVEPVPTTRTKLRVAQREAEAAVALVHEIGRLLERLSSG